MGFGSFDGDECVQTGRRVAGVTKRYMILIEGFVRVFVILFCVALCMFCCKLKRAITGVGG